MIVRASRLDNPCKQCVTQLRTLKKEQSHENMADSIFDRAAGVPLPGIALSGINLPLGEFTVTRSALLTVPSLSDLLNAVTRYLLIACICTTTAHAQSLALPWSGHGHDPQHSGISQIASRTIQRILWQTPVDLAKQYSGTSLLAHYGSVLVTRANTVVVPVKTGATDGFRVEGRDGGTGALKWTETTDYSLPAHNWVPHYCAALTPKNRLYFAGAGGTVFYRDTPDDSGNPSGSRGQQAFYGIANYSADATTFNNNVKINTAITADRYGNIFFGFVVTDSVMLPGDVPLLSGIARIAEDGAGTWVAAKVAADDVSISALPMNLAPALSNDHKTLYIATSDSSTFGYLLALNSRTLATTGKVRLKDVLSPSNDARMLNDGTASPCVGPDGDVYFGVFEHSWGANHYRGWLLHFNSTLTQTKIPGAFGWDQTPSVVPASLVTAYQGTSEYLLLSKYNHYAQAGGDGVNRIAILDPNDSFIDPISGATVMKEIITIAGITPDTDYLVGHPNAVREWCLNSVAIDTFKHSAILNNEDGKVYRWDLHTNTLTEPLRISAGIGQAYTPTIIGVDGTVYAIGDGFLFAIGEDAP